MPKFHCANCNQHIDAPDQMAGTSASCPTCGAAIIVPNLESDETDAINEQPSKLGEESDRKPIKNAKLKDFFKASAYAFGFIFAGSFIRPFVIAGENEMIRFSFVLVVGMSILKFIYAALASIPFALIAAFIAGYDWKKKFWSHSATIYPKLVAFIATFFYFLFMLAVLISILKLGFGYSQLIPVTIALILSFIACYSWKKRFWLSAVKIYPKFLVGIAVIILVFDLFR
jgi:hypothetical protein